MNEFVRFFNRNKKDFERILLFSAQNFGILLGVVIIIRMIIVTVPIIGSIIGVASLAALCYAGFKFYEEKRMAEHFSIYLFMAGIILFDMVLLNKFPILPICACIVLILLEGMDFVGKDYSSSNDLLIPLLSTLAAFVVALTSAAIIESINESIDNTVLSIAMLTPIVLFTVLYNVIKHKK